MREGRRNFPFVKVKGLERGLGAARSGSSLPVCGLTQHTELTSLIFSFCVCTTAGSEN